jgi:hypothetical protein
MNCWRTRAKSIQVVSLRIEEKGAAQTKVGFRMGRLFFLRSRKGRVLVVAVRQRIVSRNSQKISK